MKKILASLLVLALCAPAMAGVNVSAAADGTDLVISIETTEGAAVRGLALLLDSDGPTVDETSATVDPNFNAYIDDYYLNGVTELPGSGTPLALVGAPGPIVGATEDAVLSMGVLKDDQGAFQGSVEVARIAYSGAGTVCISLDSLRGNIVGDELGDITLVDAVDDQICVDLGGCTSCLGDQDLDGSITLFGDALNVALTLDAVGYADITPVPAGYECADVAAPFGTLDLFNDLFNIALALDAVGYADIPCPGPF